MKRALSFYDSVSIADVPIKKRTLSVYASACPAYAPIKKRELTFYDSIVANITSSQYFYDNLVLPTPETDGLYFYDNLIKTAFVGMSFYDNVGVQIIPTGVVGLSFYDNVILGSSGYVIYFMPL